MACSISSSRRAGGLVSADRLHPIRALDRLLDGIFFTANGFSNRFRKWCDEAGLPDCSAQGLRKAGATIAAENGATETQLMAIFGWSTSKQVAHYTRAVSQERAAGGSMHLLVPKSKSGT